VRAGTSTTPVPQAVHTPVHMPEPLAVPELSPAPPSLRPRALGSSSPGATAPVSSTQAATSSAPSTSTPVTTGATAPVHPAQAVASSANPMASVCTTGPASPAAHTQAVASKTGCTIATRPVSIPPVKNVHSMRTRGKANIAQPMDRLNLHAMPMSPLPCSIRDALSDPNWHSAMQAEYDALLANDT
jgi:hypothetical protein